jgi:hypothetical protein
LPGRGLVDFDAAGLPAVLAEKVEGELDVFASHMRHGMLLAAVNDGLHVFAQLLEAESPRCPPQGQAPTTPTVRLG